MAVWAAAVPPGATQCHALRMFIVGSVTLAIDQPRTPDLPLQIVCHLLGSGNQLHPTGLHQFALTLSRRTTIPPVPRFLVP